MRFLKHNVVPGRREAASPEPITTNLSDKIATQAYGFRAPAFGRPRNDALRIAESDITYARNGLHRWAPMAKTSPMRRNVTYVNVVTYGAGSPPWGF